MSKIHQLAQKARRYWPITAFLILILIAGGVVFQRQADLPDRSLSMVMTEINSGKVDEVIIKPYAKIVEVKLDDSEAWYETSYTDDEFGGDLATQLSEAGVDYEVKTEPLWQKAGSYLGALLAPMIIILLIFAPSIIRRRKEKKRLEELPEPPSTRLSDVGANAGVVEEIKQIVASLKEPNLFKGRCERTKGVLLYGPPGTGKTLIAMAMAGEAGVSVIFVSASDLVANYAGQSANRINDLYRRARHIATVSGKPVLVIIDEIDAIATKRSDRDDSASQDDVKTLNALLVQFGGIGANDHIVTVGITNRKEVIEPALLRGGRLGQHILVPLPDLDGRTEIIKIHLKKSELKLKEAEIATLARLTGGMGGADIANILNETGQDIYHGLEVNEERLWDFCLEAILKVKFGPTRQFPGEPDIEAYAAERVAAQAIVAFAFKHLPNAALISRQCRGDSYGTVLLPGRPKDSPKSVQELSEHIAFNVAGRVAEEMLHGDNITTSSGKEMEEAAKLATQFVCTFGWKDVVIRPIDADAWRNDPQAAEIAYSVSEILAQAERRVKAILSTHRHEFNELTKMVMDAPDGTVYESGLDRYSGEIVEPPQEPLRPGFLIAH